MKIAVACDHGGLNLKKALFSYLERNGYEYVDFGTYTAESCDYPDFALKAAEAVANGECERGIVICSSGIGVSIAANKVKGIRAALCCNEHMAKMTRLHNDSNVLAIGAAIVTEEEAKKATKNEADNPETQKLFKEYAEKQIVLETLLVR